MAVVMAVHINPTGRVGLATYWRSTVTGKTALRGGRGFVVLTSALWLVAAPGVMVSRGGAGNEYLNEEYVRFDPTGRKLVEGPADAGSGPHHNDPRRRYQ
jgi:hypothetical protein